MAKTRKALRSQLTRLARTDKAKLARFLAKNSAEIANSIFSDQGPENPKLGNRAPQRNAPPPPTSGMSGQDSVWDYFRDDRSPGKNLKGDVEQSVTPGRVTMSVRMRYNPIRDLTPDRMVGYLEQFRLGFFRMPVMAWDAMERRDYQIQAVAPKRKKAVARHGYDILTAAKIPEGMEALAEEQQQFLEYFYDHITVTTALEPDEHGGFALLVRQMMDAIGKRYAVHEIIWQPDDAGNLTAKLIFCPLWWFEGTRGKLRFLDSEFQVYGRDMSPGEWLVTVHDGIMEACSLVFILKHAPLKSWAALCDKFGQPGILGKTDAPYRSKEWNDMVDAVNQFSEEWAAVTNRSGEISLVEAKVSSGGSNLFSDLVERMDKALTTLWRGADLGTSSRKDATGASLQQDETDILESDDAQIANETLMTGLSRYALEWKFGPGTPQLAYLKIRVPEEKDTDAILKALEFILANGGAVSKKSTYENLNVEMPQDGEDVLKAPEPAPPAPPPTDQLPEEKLPQVANEAPGASSGYEDAAARDLAAALAPTLDILNRRLAALADIDDPDLLRQRATELMAWINANEKHILNNPAMVDALHNLFSGAFANGLAAKTPTA